MGALDNENIFTRNNKTLKFYNTKISRSMVLPAKVVSLQDKQPQ